MRTSTAVVGLMLAGSACTYESVTAKVVIVSDSLSFHMVSRNGKPLPQRTVASAKDTTFLLGGELLAVDERTWHVMDSVRAVVSDASQFYSDVHRTLRIGYGSRIGDQVRLTWQGGGVGDLIRWDADDRITLFRSSGDTLLYVRGAR